MLRQHLQTTHDFQIGQITTQRSTHPTGHKQQGRHIRTVARPSGDIGGRRVRHPHSDRLLRPCQRRPDSEDENSEHFIQL